MINSNLMTKDNTSLPLKVQSQSLTSYARSLTKWYVDKTDLAYRKKAGQYFTPTDVSDFMVKQYEIPAKDQIKVLDPGAGLGVFESSLCEYIKLQKRSIQIIFDLYETDSNIIPLLDLNMKACQEDMHDHGFDLSYTIYNGDFILLNTTVIDNQEYNDKMVSRDYDLVIANPPYYRLKKDAPQLVAIRKIINGPPNIYPIFMVLAALLLKNSGQLTMLTPRSYCSGSYYKQFRNWFLEIVKPQSIHVFESRSEIFKEDKVLQEIIILSATKTTNEPRNVQISVSRGIPSQKYEQCERYLSYEKVVSRKGNNLSIRIPTSTLNDRMVEAIDNLQNDFNSLGYKVSTGPVVPFRAKSFLSSELKDNSISVPLLWMHNIVNGMIKWPVVKKKKQTKILNINESRAILIPNRNYILIKRFSTKEGKQRINTGVYLKRRFNIDYVGIENHVNYIYRIDRELTTNEAYGLGALLNSKIYNMFFQITNGNTQVNANEIKDLPLPPINIIKNLGKSVRTDYKMNPIDIESLIINALSLDYIIDGNMSHSTLLYSKSK